MKFRVTLKTPDALDEAIHEAVEDSLMDADDDLDTDEIVAVGDIRSENWREISNTWFKHGECLTVEIDTDARTCVVVPVKR